MEFLRAFHFSYLPITLDIRYVLEQCNDNGEERHEAHCKEQGRCQD